MALQWSVNVNDVGAEIGQLTELHMLELDGKGLGGTLPGSLGDLPQLEKLSLKENASHGTTPLQLCNALML